MEPIITARGLTKTYEVFRKKPGVFGAIKSLLLPEKDYVSAVKSVSFEIHKGEMVGFIGPNGAGKTTTLKMISGLLHPTSGTLSVLGFTPHERKYDFLGRISLLLGQKSQLWWDLPPIETFKVTKDIYGLTDRVYKETLGELIELLDIKHILNVPVRKLSLGERMRCELVVSLLHIPELLLLDEPTIGLDVLVQKKIRAFLRSYNEAREVTVLLTSHYMEDVRELCRRLIVINHGQIVYDGDIRSLISTYGDEKYLRVTFLGEVKKESLSKFGTVMEFYGTQVLFRVGRKEHASVASAILQEFDVDDLDIQEPRLEDIVSKIFAKKVDSGRPTNDESDIIKSP